ncbi:GNAT family N-acetyltransferase [Patescibacteria group bacterium]|nr:GNAT family N-acetyltransferase [Patescibacteria group bacterium]
MLPVTNKFLQNQFNNPQPIKLRDFKLEPLDPKHLGIYHQIYSSPETVRYQRVNRCTNKTQSLDQLKSRLARRDQAKASYYIVYHHNKPVGGFSINRINYSQRHFSIGFGILKKYWGRGLATKLVTRFTAWAYQNVKPSVIKANTMKGNLASQQVLQRAGFSRYYTRRKGAEIRGKRHDVYYYRLPKT